jgi:hypothetical protein
MKCEGCGITIPEQPEWATPDMLLCDYCLKEKEEEKEKMSEPTLTCPKCGTEIKITESLAAPMVAAVEEKYQAQLAQKDDDLKKKEDAVQESWTQLERAEKALDNRKAGLQEEVRLEVEEGQLAIRIEERKKAEDAAAAAVKEAQDELAAKDAKLMEAQKEQANLLRKQRELNEEKRELDLTVEKKIQAGLNAAREKAQKDAEDLMGLRVKEKEETIAGMAKQIEELRRRAEQGSQQLQGEVQELQLEETLREKFPEDSIDPVPKGVSGGDALQSVIVNGHLCGTILWESKRTKAWSNAWLAKLRDDQRAAKADIAIIVSQTLPKEMDTLFDVIDKVWVCGPTVAMALGAVLRDGLYRAAAQDAISAGMETKAELVYQYLTGAQFKRRVEAIVEAFSTMKEDLDKERKAITKQWVKRETQIERVMQSTVGMYGDLQGIAGSAIHEVEGLEMKALESAQPK